MEVSITYVALDTHKKEHEVAMVLGLKRGQGLFLQLDLLSLILPREKGSVPFSSRLLGPFRARLKFTWHPSLPSLLVIRLIKDTGVVEKGVLCHPEPFDFAQDEPREESDSRGNFTQELQILRSPSE